MLSLMMILFQLLNTKPDERKFDISLPTTSMCAVVDITAFGSISRILKQKRQFILG